MINDSKKTVFLVIVLSASTAHGDILAGPFSNPANGHEYYLLTNANWTDSEAEAVNLGGHLVTINDAAENQWVFATFAAYDGVDRLLWIGLNDMNQTGIYAWSSGQDVIYENWSAGEPNNPAQEYFVYLYCDNVPPWAQPRRWNNFRDVASDIGKDIFGVVEVESTVTEVVPDSFLVTQGIHISGGIAELTSSDDEDLTIRPFGPGRAEFEVKGVSPFANPSSFELTLECSASPIFSNVTQTIELFDYDTQAWEEVDARRAARITDDTLTLAATGDLSRFVEVGTRSVEARIRFRSVNLRRRFVSNTDQFVWTIGQ